VDKVTDEVISDIFGISRVTLSKWRAQGAAIPSDAQQNDGRLEVTPFERGFILF
jgi:phage terminase Nu1 subunit (DNA packaging protein)